VVFFIKNLTVLYNAFINQYLAFGKPLIMQWYLQRVHCGLTWKIIFMAKAYDTHSNMNCRYGQVQMCSVCYVDCWLWRFPHF